MACGQTGDLLCILWIGARLSMSGIPGEWQDSSMKWRGRLLMRFHSITLLTLSLAAVSVCFAQSPQEKGLVEKSEAASSASDRYFFPKNFFRGYTEAGFFPSHNEVDLDRCRAAAGSFGTGDNACAAFGRYVLGGYMEFQPFARKVGPVPLERFYIFLEPRGFLGRNLPQVQYTASFDAILFEWSVGIGLQLTKNLELRMWQHQNDWLGRYGHNLGPADLGSNGPYGLYTGIAARWYFGGYGRHR